MIDALDHGRIVEVKLTVPAKESLAWTWLVLVIVSLIVLALLQEY